MNWSLTAVVNPDNKPQSNRKEKTMLTPELSRLKGAPSTCVCSVGHRNEKAIMGCVIRARYEIKPDTCESSKIPISACLRCEERDEERGACITPRRRLELVTDMANEKDVGPDRLRGVCLIERVEHPAVLNQHRGIGQGDTGISPNSPSVAVRRGSKQKRDGLWRSGDGPSGQDPNDGKAEEGRLKEYTGFS